MEDQNEREAWNQRWLRQLTLWQDEVEDLLDQAEVLLAMIQLAKSQLRQDPPE